MGSLCFAPIGSTPSSSSPSALNPLLECTFWLEFHLKGIQLVHSVNRSRVCRADRESRFKSSLLIQTEILLQSHPAGARSTARAEPQCLRDTPSCPKYALLGKNTTVFKVCALGSMPVLPSKLSFFLTLDFIYLFINY